MNISLETVIVFAANGLTSLVATALLMLVLWQAPRQRSNQLFALVMLLLGAYGAINGFARFTGRLGMDPQPVFYLATQFYGTFTVALFFFASEFSGRRSPLIRALRWLGIILLIYAAVMLWTGHLTTNFEAIDAEEGVYHWEFTAAGMVAPATVFIYLLATTLMFYSAPDAQMRPLALAPIFAAASTISATLLWPTVQLPLNALFLAAAALALGMPVLREELFNPLARLHDELAEKNFALQEANRLRSQFLANMSHELRTPLNSIIGYTEMIIAGTYGDLNETQRDRLEKVIRNGNHLLALINDVLDLNKIETGRLVLERRRLDTTALLDHVLATIMPLAADKNLAVHGHYKDAPDLFADEGRVRQILTNLLANAVKFTHEGSITLRAFRAGNMVQIEVQDTGIGIDPSLQDAIFTEFRQGDNSPTRQYEGTGLGLAITRRLVLLHNGRIWLESQPGKGSTFYTQLPAADPAVRTSSPISGSGQTILIIDDSPDTLQMLSETLTSAGYRAVTALGGREGLEQARLLHPDLITLDVMMPTLDGWQVLREMKHSPETRQIPVVVISIVDNYPLAISLGAVDALTKPVDRGHLLAAINTALRTIAPAQQMLVIDDNASDRAQIMDTLRGQNYRVTGATNIQHARNWLERHTPQAVVLAITPRASDSFNLLEELRANPRLSPVPVVVLAAHELPPEQQERVRANCAVVLPKDPSSLGSRLLDATEDALHNAATLTAPCIEQSD